MNWEDDGTLPYIGCDGYTTACVCQSRQNYAIQSFFLFKAYIQILLEECLGFLSSRCCLVKSRVHHCPSILLLGCMLERHGLFLSKTEVFVFRSSVALLCLY